MADIEHLRQLIRGLDHDLKASQRECRDLKKQKADLESRLVVVVAALAGWASRANVVSDESPVQETVEWRNLREGFESSARSKASE